DALRVAGAETPVEGNGRVGRERGERVLRPVEVHDELSGELPVRHELERVDGILPAVHPQRPRLEEERREEEDRRRHAHPRPPAASGGTAWGRGGGRGAGAGWPGRPPGPGPGRGPKNPAMTPRNGRWRAWIRDCQAMTATTAASARSRRAPVAQATTQRPTT